MANIIITSTTNSIIVTFGVYASIVEVKKQTWRKDRISDFHLLVDESAVHCYLLGEKEWFVSYNGSGDTFQIDSINGVAPISNSDLYDKLIALIA